MQINDNKITRLESRKALSLVNSGHHQVSKKSFGGVGCVGWGGCGGFDQLKAADLSQAEQN